MTSSSKQSCVYCGNNPVSHTATYFFETLGTYTSGYDDFIANSLPGRFLNAFADRVERFFLWSLSLVGAVKWNNDPSRAASHRGGVLWEEADKREILMQSVILYGKDIDMYRAKVGKKWIYFHGLPRKAKRRIETWLDDKAALKKKLLEAGLPAAPGGSFTNIDDALIAFENLKKPVIVKPRSGSRGRHTTTHIYTTDELREAFRIAQMLGKHVVMEEHLHGSVYRGTVIGGKLAGILRGDPPRVVGDGKHTIATLVEHKNLTRDPRISDVKITPQTERFLGRQGLSIETIIPEGKVVDLSEKIGISYGGSSAEIYDETHPDVKATIIRAAELVNDNLVGFDFIIPDPTTDPSKQTWGIIECNTLPFINLHHDPIEGTPRNAAALVWDMWEENKGKGFRE